MKRKFYKLLLLTAIIIALALVLKSKPLTLFSNYLIVQDDRLTSTVFVLSGNAFDRGNEVVRLEEGHSFDLIVCTGNNQPPDFKALEIDMTEGELTARHMIANGVDSGKVRLIRKGTSTQEEKEAILKFCKDQNLKEINLLSGKFHTRRVKHVFKKEFEKEGIQVFLLGAPSTSYEENKWWQSEYGLIALNNEYIKLIYYLVKY